MAQLIASFSLKTFKGRFLEVLISILERYLRGKTGCMLSPTLFNFYRSDLPKLLNSTASSEDITLGEKSISGSLHDLIT